MAHIKAASSGRFIRSASTSLLDFSLAATARDHVISGSSITTSTIQDSIINTNVSGATIDHEFDVATTIPLSEITSIANLSPSIISFNGVNATRISDGAGALVFSAKKTQRFISFNVSRSTGQTTTTFQAFAAGSLGNSLVAAIAAMLISKIAPTFTPSVNAPLTFAASSTICDIFNGDGTRNSGGWWGSQDLTCIPQSIGTNGVLVSPRDMIFANHYGLTNPTFRDNSGNTYSRTISASRQVGTTDILVATLNADLPGDITPAKVLPSNWRSYLPSPQYGYPCIFTNQDRRLLVADTYSAEMTGNEFNAFQSMDATRGQWWYTVRKGDSGSPAFMLINGSPVALLAWHSSGAGPCFADNISGINAAITANDSPYSLTTVNLSGFNSY